ncbi:unnamed protein product [Aphanomyces euteiches]
MRCGADKLTVVKLKERTTTRRVCSSHLMNAVMPEIPLMAIPVSAFLDQHADLGAHVDSAFLHKECNWRRATRVQRHAVGSPVQDRVPHPPQWQQGAAASD